MPGPVALLRQSWGMLASRPLVLISIPAFSVTSLLLAHLLNQLPLPSPAKTLLLLPASIGIIFHLWGEIAIIFAIHNPTATVTQAFKSTASKILPNLWLGFLSGLITIGGFPLIILPIVFSIWFSFSRFALVLENIGGLTALLKSRWYTQGQFWPLASRYIFLGSILLPIALPIYYLDEIAKQQTLSAIVALTLDLILLPFVSSYTYLLYSHLKTARGEAAFSPSKKSKILLYFLALLGPIIFLLTFFLLLLTSINPAKKLSQARNAQRNADLNFLQQSLELYRVNNSTYPTALSDLTPQYISTILRDPKTNSIYTYTIQDSGQSYRLCINFEKPATPKCVSPQ